MTDDTQTTHDDEQKRIEDAIREFLACAIRRARYE